MTITQKRRKKSNLEKAKFDPFFVGGREGENKVGIEHGSKS